MNANKKRALAKKLYLAGYSLQAIADTLGVSLRTVQNYKAKEKDWDDERAKLALDKGGETLYRNFVLYMQEFIKEIKESSLKPEVKAEKISQIGDAFAKMKRIAMHEDPESYKLGIIKHTLSTLLESAKTQLDLECMQKLIDLIDSTSEELSRVDL